MRKHSGFVVNSCFALIFLSQKQRFILYRRCDIFAPIRLSLLHSGVVQIHLSYANVLDIYGQVSGFWVL